MNILVAVPTFETIYPDTFKSIYDLDDCGHELQFEYVRGYDCAMARNKIVRLALDRNVDYVLMVDNDVVLPKDAIRNLLEHPKDVCLGYYAHRGTNNRYNGRSCVCKLKDANGVPYTNYPLESEYTAEELHSLRDEGVDKVRIHGGGSGCAFVRVDVYRKLTYPWYKWVLYRSGKILGEDLYFCESCKKIGIPVWTDTRVECGHIFRYIQQME